MDVSNVLYEGGFILHKKNYDRQIKAIFCGSQIFDLVTERMKPIFVVITVYRKAMLFIIATFYYCRYHFKLFIGAKTMFGVCGNSNTLAQL